MGKLHACMVIAVSALAACGDDGGAATIDASVDAPPDAKEFLDAPPPMFDFSCMGNAAPTTATANIALSGTVTRVELSGLQPAFVALAGADLEACVADTACNGPDKKGTATSANDGSFNIATTTGGAPLDVFISMTEGSSRPTLTYPDQPFTADQGMIPILTFDPTLISLLSNLGCTQNDSTNGIIGLAVTDCADAPITDSTNVDVTIKQGGTAVSGTTFIDLGDLAMQAAGTFLICNVPANPTTEVGGSYMGMPLRAHNVKVVAGTTTATILRPGY